MDEFDEADLAEYHRGIEEIKADITALIREAASQGVALEHIRGRFIFNVDGKAYLTYVDIEETRTI